MDNRYSADDPTPPAALDGPSKRNSGLHPSISVPLVKKWQQILGELQSMALVIPGARGLFSECWPTNLVGIGVCKDSL